MLITLLSSMGAQVWGIVLNETLTIKNISRKPVWIDVQYADDPAGNKKYSMQPGGILDETKLVLERKPDVIRISDKQ
jgi:hypothetical protein